MCSQPHPDIGDNEMRLVSTQSSIATEANIVCQRNGKCKWCGSDKVVKDGKDSKGQQIFRCKDCGHRFIANGAPPRMRTQSKTIATAIGLFMDGLSTRKVRSNLRRLVGDMKSNVSVYNWLVKYSKMSVDFVKCFQTHTSEVWHADETAIKIRGKDHWYWFVMEHDTRFILSSHLTEWGRKDKHAVQLFRDAKRMASYSPKYIVTDKLPAYRAGVNRNFYTNTKPRTEHINRIGFVKLTNNNMIERSNGVIKDRLKPMRGLKNAQSARILLDGFNLVHRNFLTVHSTIGMTPAKACHIDLPIRDGWADMIRWSTYWQSLRAINQTF